MTVTIGLKQHIGNPATPIVAQNDRVARGQLIGVCDNLGANIHASCVGRVIEICQKFIKIEMDEEQFEDFVKIKQTDNYLESVREAGIVGCGGAGFPAHVKFATNLDGGVFILNAAECEPIFAHNLRVLEDAPELILRGMGYAMEMTNARTAYIALKPKHTKALAAINAALPHFPKIEIRHLPDIYPAGDERVIIREILGITLPPGGLPKDAGAIVSNVETIKRVAEAIELGKPVITKDFTIAGRLTNAQTGRVFLDAPIGLPIKNFIDQCGGYIHPAGEIVLGGAFTGIRGNENSPITKTIGGIFVAMPLPDDTRDFAILACECGADEARLREIVGDMGGKIISADKCKRMTEINGRWRCDEPGKCPGQAEKILAAKKQGANAVMLGFCED